MNKCLIKSVLVSLVSVCILSTTAISNRIVLADETSTNATATNSSGYTFKSVNITGGGYIPSVIFNKSEKDLVYLRTDMGGAYRWDSKNSKWVQLLNWISSKDWNLLGCESIATDPIDTDRVYIAAGTYTNDWAENGCILRSTDRGETFEKIQLPFKLGGNMPGRNMGERLTIDPNDNRVLYFGARSGNGLWKSTDYGSTWNKVESFKETGDYADEWSKDPVGIAWVIFDPTSSSKGQPCQTLYAGVANKGKENTVFCSKDGGETWNPVEGQPTYDWEVTSERPGNYMPHHGVLASNGMLYISYNNQEGPYNGNHGGVWKYNTKTGEWTDITPVKNSDAIYWGYGGMTIDAVNPDVIMTTTLNSYWPDANIYRSTDGGKTWEDFWRRDEAWQRINSFKINYSAAPWLDWSKTDEAPTISPKLGWMVGDIQIDPFNSDHMVYGTGATLYASYNLTNLDQGKKMDIQVQAQGIEETSVLDLITPPSGYAQLISGTGDIGGFVHTDINISPKMPTNPTISNCASMDYAELNPNIIVRSGDVAKIGLSKDGGKSWSQPTGTISLTNGGGDYLTSGGNIAMSADGKTMVYSPNGDGATVVYSHNDGAKWIAANGVPAHAKVISDRVNPNKFYAIASGELYISTDAGENFEKTGATGLDNSGSYDASAVPGVEGDIWIAGGPDGKTGVWHSTDGGQTLERLSNVDAGKLIGFGKAAPGKDYMSIYAVATIDGVEGIFRSDDKGETWTRVNDDQHQYGTKQTITGDPNVYGRFYVGTNGLGIVCGELADK